MDISFSAPLSGLDAVSKRQDVTAHNVANVNTPGFESYNSIQTETGPQGVRIAAITRTPNPDSAVSGTDLAKETVDQMVQKNEFSADLRVIKVKDRMLGELLDLIG